MKVLFHKYQGTGNDFILIDNRSGNIYISKEEINLICNRHFGIGADGLMLLLTEPGYDFGMKYFNADGRESTMCGNGGRCITAFARTLGVIERWARFLAIDGEHTSEILSEQGNTFFVKLRMSDVPANAFQKPVFNDPLSMITYTVDTGSPHLVVFAENVKSMDVVAEGRNRRNLLQFSPGGINVDFAQISDNDGLFVRTYERGVEDETLSCGTGVTAAALAYTKVRLQVVTHKPQPVPAQSSVISHTVETLGGILKVSFRQESDSFTDIWLEGPAEFVFCGEINV